MSEQITRRDFVKTGTVATAAAGVSAFVEPTYTVYAGNPDNKNTSGILNYNEQMEYRQAGKTGLMVSAVCLGGHWKRLNKVIPGLYKGGGWLSADLNNKEFEQNRWDLVSRCIDRGISYIDACTAEECIMYSKALRGRREKMYLGFSWYQKEMRSLSDEWQKAKKQGKPKPPGWITQKLKEALEFGMKECDLDYVDVWRITCHEESSRHEDVEMEECMAALAWAKRKGHARFTGISSHDRPHIKRWLELAPKELEVVVTPYTARTRMKGTKVVKSEEGNSTRVVRTEGGWEKSLWYAMQKNEVAWFGIKPFTSGSLFKGDGTPGNPYEEEDNRIARLTIRAILTNPLITAPIPGLATPAQVDNVALAVLERRKLDLAEQAELDAATDRAFAQLDDEHQWLKNWVEV